MKKRSKSSRYRGWKSQGRGTKRKPRGSGHRGGFGMAGTGKRADQKKTLVLKLYGNKYFGKDKALRRKIKKKLDVIDLREIVSNIDSMTERGIAKATKDGYELDLKEYKILGDGDIKIKIKINAGAASKSAIEKVKNAGGEIIIETSKKSHNLKTGF